MKKFLWWFLFCALVACFERDGLSQNPPAKVIGIPTTKVQGGTAGNCLTIGSDANKSLSQGTCGGAPSGAAGGNLTGTYPNPGVTGVRTGTIAGIPATCVTGDIYFATDATAGANIYQCTATNTWTAPSTGASPCGALGQVQLYATATTFGCDVNFKWQNNPGNMTKGIYSGDNSSVSSDVMGFTGALNLFSGDGGPIGIEFGVGSGAPVITQWGIQIAGAADGVGSIYGVISDLFQEGTGGQIIGYRNNSHSNGLSGGTAYPYIVSADNQNGGSGQFDTVYGYFAYELNAAATNAYDYWFDNQGVGRCKADNTFDSVSQTICGVYNPQFAKYTPGAANFERLIYGQWESNEAWIRTERGGSGVARRIGIGALAGLDIFTNDVANPFTMPKMSVAASAPGAAICDLRLLAGTNMGTGKIVINCGTSATEVTIADNIGAGF